jgi:hypothetical protein
MMMMMTMMMMSLMLVFVVGDNIVDDDLCRYLCMNGTRTFLLIYSFGLVCTLIDLLEEECDELCTAHFMPLFPLMPTRSYAD